MPRIQLDMPSSPYLSNSPQSPFLPSPTTSSSRRVSSSSSANNPNSLPFPLSLPKRKLLTLLGLALFLVFLFGWKSSGPPSEAGLYSWGGKRVPLGEYDPHGSSEGVDLDEISAGNGVRLLKDEGALVDMEKTGQELELEMGLYGGEDSIAPEPAPTPTHMTPTGLQSQLVSLIYFLSEGGIVSSTLDLESEVTVDSLLAAAPESTPDDADTDALADPPRRAAKKKQPKKFKKAEKGWEEYIEDRYPLVIFSKSFCPYSRKAKSIISFLHPSPAPLIIEVDLRPDSLPLKRLLTHLTSRSTFPNILLGFEPLGGGDEIELLFAEGGLGKKLKSAGLKVKT